MTEESFAGRVAAAARELQDHDSPQGTMESAVALALANVDGCDAAGISIVRAKRKVETPAATDDTAVVGDALQYEIGEGPCLDAIWERLTVYSPDLSAESRWPTWGPRVTEETGARSILAFQLFTNNDILGALNMYSRQLDGFTEDDRVEGLALAAHIALAVAAAQKVEQLDSALSSRTVTAQATGMMMERFDIDAARAFALLTRLSMHQNTKLRDVAAQVVETRQLPGESRGSGAA